MAVACHTALTSRYLVAGKFAVTKNLSNARPKYAGYALPAKEAWRAVSEM